MRYRWVNIEQEPEAMAYVEQINDGKRIVPTIVCPTGTILVEGVTAAWMIRDYLREQE